MKELIDLFIAFFRIGGLTFGGGLAMLPMLKYELIEKRDWVTEDEILDYYAIGQCTPGSSLSTPPPSSVIKDGESSVPSWLLWV